MKQIQYADFPIEEYERRIRRATALMAEQGVEALVLTDPSNLRYLFGFQNMLQMSVNRSFVGLFVASAPDESTLWIPHDCQDAPQTWCTQVRFWDEGNQPPFDERLADMGKVIDRIQELGLGAGGIGIELGEGMRLGMPVCKFDELRQALREVTVIDAAAVMWPLRRIKSEAEIDILRQIVRLSLDCIQDGLEHLREGMTERELYRQIYSRMFTAGADEQGFLAVYFGYDSWQRANMAPTDGHPLRRGDPIMIDGGAVLNGYCADVYRMGYFGEAPEAWARIYDDVRDTTAEMIRGIRAGVLCCEVYETGCRLLKQRGLGAFVDTLSFGHGIGLNVHEMPDLNKNNREPLEAGMVLAIEPWIFDRGEHGLFNWEDMVVVRENGAELLGEDSSA